MSYLWQWSRAQVHMHNYKQIRLLSYRKTQHNASNTLSLPSLPVSNVSKNIISALKKVRLSDVILQWIFPQRLSLAANRNGGGTRRSDGRPGFGFHDARWGLERRRGRRGSGRRGGAWGGCVGTWL